MKLVDIIVIYELNDFKLSAKSRQISREFVNIAFLCTLSIAKYVWAYIEVKINKKINKYIRYNYYIEPTTSHFTDISIVNRKPGKFKLLV